MEFEKKEKLKLTRDESISKASKVSILECIMKGDKEELKKIEERSKVGEVIRIM